MRKASIALLASALSCGGLAFPLALPTLALPSVASAQDMSFSLDETETSESDDESESSSGGEGGGSGDVFSDILGGGSGESGSGSESGSTSTTTSLGVSSGGSAGREGPAAQQEAREEIFAVQRIYALRINRAEVAVSGAFSLNDPFVQHNGISAALNYWFTNVLAVGLNFTWYEGLENESDLNYFVRRSTRLAVRANNYQFGTNLNFTYVPIYGKFSFFNEFIFQYDAYIVGGVGLMMTKPIPVIDQEVRSFGYDPRLAFNLGIGLRVFLTRWLAIYAEIRDYLFLEQLEAGEVALGDTARMDPNTWLEDGPELVNNFTAHIGLTIFLPFDFEYHQPR